MPYIKTTAAAMAVVTLLTGCAVAPLEPTVAATPPSKKSPEAFQEDQEVCQAYANQQVSDYTDNPPLTLAFVMVGVILLPGLGWAWAGERGIIGGGVLGAGGGTALGMSEEERARQNAQGRYDLAYQQCMYVEGNAVAGFEPSMLLAAP
jgi:hypothetical protein